MPSPVASLFLALAAAPLATAQQRPPNVVVIFIDDMGYADIGPLRRERLRDAEPRPHGEARAAVFTDFMRQPGGLLRVARGAPHRLLQRPRRHLSARSAHARRTACTPTSLTLAELCKQKGYATACFGKWHLGHHPNRSCPSNMVSTSITACPTPTTCGRCTRPTRTCRRPPERRKKGYPDLPLIEGNEVVDASVDGDEQAQLTTRYTERAVSFIERHQEQPFFLYVPHSMVHVPLFVSDKFKDKSGHGLFGDVVMELDWSVGQILAALRRCELDDDTLVVFTSDNGPWLSYGDHAGSAGPLREGKGTIFEGGIREPTLMRWPGPHPGGRRVPRVRVHDRHPADGRCG